MSSLAFGHMPVWVMVFSLAVHLVVGLGLGYIYFRIVQWNARLFSKGCGAMTTVALIGGRFVLLGGLLVLTSQEGALPLLAMTAGIIIARSVLVRGLGKAVP